mmetsp:Transcript_22365/g.28937  ORF Transcript_22365/g.28937 Transcript_22365/m.28937 type:complete len:1148 (-) Transcript_22365:234-3677(-)
MVEEEIEIVVQGEWPPRSGPLEAYDCERYALKSSRVVVPVKEGKSDDLQFEVIEAIIIVHGEKILAIERGNTLNKNKWKNISIRDVGNLVILPGIVDSGARFGECASLKPGSISDCCQGFAKGARAAAAGGITTSIDMASLDADAKAANDLLKRSELAIQAGICIDIALGIRLENISGKTPRQQLHAYQKNGAVAASAYLTSPSHETAAIEPRICAEALGILPIIIDTIFLTSEELAASSPFHHLPYFERLDAHSPLMLLPFYQVEAMSPDSHHSNDNTQQNKQEFFQKKEIPPRRTNNTERGRAFRRKRTPRENLFTGSFFCSENKTKPRRQSSIWEVTCFSELPNEVPGLSSPLETPPREYTPILYGSPPREFTSLEPSQAWVNTFLQAELDTYDQQQDSQKRRRKTTDILTSSAPVSTKNFGLILSPANRRRSENDVHSSTKKGVRPRSAEFPRPTTSKPKVNRILGSIPNLLRVTSPPRSRSPPRPRGSKIWCGGSPEETVNSDAHGRSYSTMDEMRSESNALSLSTMLASVSTASRVSEISAYSFQDDRPSDFRQSASTKQQEEAQSASPKQQEEAQLASTKQTPKISTDELSDNQSFTMRSVLDTLFDTVRCGNDNAHQQNNNDQVTISLDDSEEQRKTKPKIIASLSKGAFVELEGSETLPVSRRPKSLSPPSIEQQSATTTSHNSCIETKIPQNLTLPARQIRRPAPIKIFKENDEHTRRAVRQDYSLYCQNHRSAAGAEGLLALTEAIRCFDAHSPPLSPPPISFFCDASGDSTTNCCDGGQGTLSDESDFDETNSEDIPMGAVVKSISCNALHIARFSTQQETRVFEDCRRTLTGNNSRNSCTRSVTAGIACYNLFFSEEEVPYGATIFKVQPPIRHEAHRRALVRAVRSGLVHCISSGHAPCHSAGKPCPPDNDGDFNRALPGTGSGANELLLPALWTALHRHNLTDLARLLAFNPARLLQLYPAKGCIAVRAHADFTIFDPDSEYILHAKNLVQAPQDSRNCLYHGRKLYGTVVATILRGKLVYSHGQFRDEPNGNIITTKARILRRPQSISSNACGIVVPTCGTFENETNDVYEDTLSDLLSGGIFQSEEAPTSTVPSSLVFRDGASLSERQHLSPQSQRHHHGQQIKKKGNLY